MEHPQVILLKARQLGFSWLVLAVILWFMLFRPAYIALLTSKRNPDVVELLDTRLKGMYSRLPEWMQCRAVLVDNDHEWELSNGSRALAFPSSSGGRSFIGNFAMIDEADYIEDLSSTMAAMKPVIDNGGRIVLLSTVDKEDPLSLYKRMYIESAAGLTRYHTAFMPWNAAPWRSQAWYEAEKSDILRFDGSYDRLWQEYPSSPEEALSPATLDKRLRPEWLLASYQKQDGEPGSIPGLIIYQEQRPGRSYVIGIDPAEGNPTSDDSALEVLDAVTAEQVAELRGKIEPAVMAAYADEIGNMYNKAAILCERNNHGHAVLLWLNDNSQLDVLSGLDGRPGWLSSSKGNTLKYATAANRFREKSTLLHSSVAYHQLASILGASLKAPKGLMDDVADAYTLGLQAIEQIDESTVEVGASPTAGYRG